MIENILYSLKPCEPFDAFGLLTVLVVPVLAVVEVEVVEEVEGGMVEEGMGGGVGNTVQKFGIVHPNHVALGP
jgi:hypothetical protein